MSSEELSDQRWVCLDTGVLTTGVMLTGVVTNAARRYASAAARAEKINDVRYATVGDTILCSNRTYRRVR